MGQRRAILDDQHALAGNVFGVVDRDGRRGLDDDGPAVDSANILPQLVDGVDVGGIHLVDDDDIRDPQVGFAGVVEQFVAHAQRVGHDDVQIRLVEGRVVIAAVPDDDIGLGLRLCQDVAVVHARVDDGPAHDVGFVFLDFLNRALVFLEVGN